MVALSYFRAENVELKEMIELFFIEKQDKSQDTSETYWYAINNMSNEIFGTDVKYLKREQIESITWNVLNKYKMKLKETYSNTTVNNRISAIKSFIRYLTARNVINYNIAELDLVETLNDDSENIEMIPLETLMDYVEYFRIYEQRKGEEKKWLCLLALETGNRVQDLLSVTKNQFVKDGNDYILKSKGKNRGKGNKEYIERIGVELYNKLMKLNPTSDKVFGITYKAIQSAFDRANKHFGNTTIKYTVHSIKKLAVTLEYKYTNDILLAQRKGKHSSLETTRRYLKIEETPLVGAYTRLTTVEENIYEYATLEQLQAIISELPMDVKFLINTKLEELNKTGDK